MGGLGAVLLLSILTRYLGPSGFGRYTFVIGYVSLFYVVTDLGSQAVAVREMARDPARAGAIAGQLFILKLALSTVGFLVALTIAVLAPAASFRGAGVQFGIVLAALALFWVPASAAAGAVFQTSLRMGVPSFAEAAARFVTLALVALLAAHAFIGSHPDTSTRLVAVLAAATVGPLCGALIMFAAAQRLTDLRPRFDLALARPLIRDAIPLAIIFVLSIVHYRIDVLVLSLMKGMSTVGQYGVATKLLDVALAGSAVFIGLAYPVLSARAAGDRVLLQRTFQKTLDFMLMAGIGAAVFCSILAPQLVRLLAGPSYQAAAEPVAIIAWAIPITFANMVFVYMVAAGNRQRSAVPVVLIAIALNVGLNVLLIPRMGASAPALVTVLSESASTLGMIAVMSRHFGFGPSLTSIARIALSGALAALALAVLLRLNLVLAVCVAAVLYGAALLVLRAVTIEDLKATIRRESPV